MNKTEIVEQLASRIGTSKAEAKRLLDAQIEAMARHLACGHRVVIRGLGSFHTHEVAARRGRRPTDGAALEVPSHRHVAFRASKRLRDAVQTEESPV
jgi:nucleoid DNA-binding protein